MLGVVGGVNVGEWVSGFEGETEVFPALSKLHYSLYGTCHTSPPPPPPQETYPTPLKGE